MTNLSNNQLMPIERPLCNIIEYIILHSDDEAFCLRQVDEDGRYFLRQDKNGYCLVSFVYPVPNVCSEDFNSNGYKRIRYRGQNILKHRLIYKTYGNIPDDVCFEEMVVHHKNLNVLDNRLCNLRLMTKPNHYILHKYIDKYGIENIEI